MDISATDRSLFRDLKKKDKNSDGTLSFFADGRHGTLAFPAAAAAAGQARSWLKASLHLVLLLLQVHPPTAAGLEAVRRHWLLPGDLV